MFPATMSIAIEDAKGVADRTNGNLVEKLKAAMRETRNHWLVTNEDEQFRSAVGGVMLSYGKDSEEFKRLELEMKDLNRFSAAMVAMQAGVSVDIGSVVDKEQAYEPIGLLKLWREVKKESK